jgi:transcriptional regulator with XRE-family HTH domain
LFVPRAARTVLCVASLSVDKRNAESKATERKDTPLRRLRLQRGLTQARLAELSGVHRNTIVKLENGTTREVTSDKAAAIAAVLKATPDELAFSIRPAGAARSIRIRRLTAEQRALVAELLSLPPDDYPFVREAIEKLRLERGKKRNKRRRGTAR